MEICVKIHNGTTWIDSFQSKLDAFHELTVLNLLFNLDIMQIVQPCFRLDSDPVNSKQLREEAEMTMHELATLAQHTSVRLFSCQMLCILLKSVIVVKFS